MLPCSQRTRRRVLAPSSSGLLLVAFSSPWARPRPGLRRDEISKRGRLKVRIPLNGNDPHLNTLEGVYPNANWYEREIWDLFGITFDGHSDLRRIMMPTEWEGHPLRKDYPLGYEEPQFTFNVKEVDQKKPYAKD